MKSKQCIIIFFLLFICADIYAEAFFSGNVNSVNADSGFNALRNPALMSRQKKDSAGFFYLHSYNACNDVSADVDFAGTLTEVEVNSESDEKFNGLFSVSYVNHFKGGAFGFGIRKPDGTDQLLISENSFVLTGNSWPGPVPVKNGTIENKKSYAISTVFSYSRDFRRHESAGIQFETGVSLSETTKKISEYSSGILINNYNMDITSSRLIGNVNCGYSYITNYYQIGAVIKFGQYVYEKNEYSYQDKLTAAENSKDVSPYLFRDKGMEYTLGLGYNITGKLFFNIETSFGTPFDYERKELKDDDYGLMDEKNSIIYVNYSAVATGGLSYRYDRKLKFGFGGGAGVYSADTEGSNGIKSGKTKYNIYSVITGVEIKPAGGINYLFGLGLYYFVSKMDTGNIPPSFELEAESVYLNVMAGASTSY